MVYGTDDGVYFSNLTEPDRPPVMVLSILDVTQVDVLEQFQLLIVLSGPSPLSSVFPFPPRTFRSQSFLALSLPSTERSVQTFPLDALDPKDPTAALKRGKRISSHTTFFKAGVCVGKMLVCIVKSSPLSTTIKVMDPVEAPTKKKPQGAAFSKLMPSRHDTLKAVKVRIFPYLFFLCPPAHKPDVNGRSSFCSAFLYLGVLHPDRVKLNPLPQD
jgi:hypothetical protein